MISIYVWNKLTPDNRHLLHLPDDGNITIKMSNPLVNDSGTFSYPIKVPYQENKHVFEFPGEGESFNKKFGFDLYVGSDLFLQGDVEIQNSEGIDIYLKSGKSSVSAALRDSFLDERINGESWGDRGGVSFEDTLSGGFPAYNFVVAPIKWEEGIFNEKYMGSDLASYLVPSTLNPGVYVRYLVERIISVLGFVKERDDFDEFPDIDRLFLFSAKAGVTQDDFSSWLPHLSAHDFLKSIEHRFGFFLYFHPLKKYCEIISLNKEYSNLIADDWSSKLISIDDIPPYKKKSVRLSNSDGEDSDLLNTSEISFNSTVPSFGDLPNPNPMPVSNDDKLEDVNADEIIKIDHTPPYFVKRSKQNPESDYPSTEKELNFYNGLWIAGGQWVDNPGYYGIDDTPFFFNIHDLTNTQTIAGTENPVTNLVFTLSEETTMFANSMMALAIQAKVNSGTSELIAVVERMDGTEYGRGSVVVSSSAYAWTKAFIRLSEPVYFSNSDESRLIIRLYSKSEVSGRAITVRIGADPDVLEENGAVKFCGHVLLDPLYYYWKEIGAMGEYVYGDDDEKEEISPKGAILNNDYVHIRDMFEMPVTSMEPEAKQKEFGFSIYRGIQKPLGDNPNGYANFDTLNLELGDYSADIDGPTPLLSLRWDGIDGIVEKLRKNELFLRRHRLRNATEKLKLNVGDIADTPLYRPKLIGSQVYIISELSIPINIRKGIQPVTAELLTI